MVGRLKGNIKGSTNLSVKKISANLSVAKNRGVNGKGHFAQCCLKFWQFPNFAIYFIIVLKI